MAVTDDYAPVREAGNGVKVDFDANFPVLEATDVKVGKILNSTNVKTDMVYGVDYTVTINQSNNRPTVTYIVAPTALEDSWIGRNVPNTQTATIPTNNIFREVQVNNALDKQCMVAQQLQEQINRCPIQPETSTATVVFPEPEDGKVPAWDGTSGDMKNVDVDPAAITAAVAAAEEAQEAAEDAQEAAENAKSAAETAQGLAEAAAESIPDLASQAEAEAGTANDKYTSPLRVAQAIAALAPGLNTKFVLLTRDLSAASGDVAYTGFGFKPKAIIYMVCPNAGSEYYLVVGAMTDLPTTNSGCATFYNNNAYYPGYGITIFDNGPSAAQIGLLKSFDADGLTLTWTKTGSPTGIAYINVLAIG